MTDNTVTVPLAHYMATVKALVKQIRLNDELRAEIRDYEAAFDQVAKDAVNEDNAAWWLKQSANDVDEPIPYTITDAAPNFSTTTTDPSTTQTYTLTETAAILNRQGIDTGQNRLKTFLNTGIAWTDHYGEPREIAADYLVMTERANPSRDAVVRVTPEGINELERVMNVAV